MIEKYIGNLNLPYGINILDILVLIILILILVNIIGSFNRKRINKRFDKIPGFNINQKIISDIIEINLKLQDLDEIDSEFKLKISNLEKRTDDILDIKNIKYNPYKDMGVGGNQSFSTALVDKNGNGIILTNLYSRERTRVLLKEINNFTPRQELAPEEIELLKEIKKKV